MALSHLLSAGTRHGLEIIECKEAIGGPANARYIGLHLRPA
jgi:hypothetical protein